jgi:iron complex outermembrane receptor protein
MLLGISVALAAVSLLPQAADTVRSDTLPTARVADLEVTVARRRESLARVPMAVGVIQTEEIRRGQPTLGLDESLTTVPGVYVANRWNFSLDQRLSIRGFGSRANFGVRGVKVYLDGVPQTLPDGQSQLSNVEFGSLKRIEVLRGASSALYGNASGGALLLETEIPGAEPLGVAARFEAGSFGSSKWQVQGQGRSGPVAGSLMLSRFATDGFRQHSAADIRQVAGALYYALSGSTQATLRFLANDTPKAENPGALTAAEAAAKPDSASASNILRGADKRVNQQQASLRLEHQGDDGRSVSATVYGLLRDLENPLATPPPGPPSPTAGTYNVIDRVAGGARLEGTITPLAALRLTLGLDAQRMRDDRLNLRSDAGQPTDSVLADQRETVSETAPFVQAQWRPGNRVTVDAGVRYDWLAFAVEDRHLTDGVDNSGTTDENALSGNLGLVWDASDRFNTYGQISTAFETPTTTELVSTASGGVGFNSALGPQRATSVELGARAGIGVVRLTIAAFHINIRDAITQQREVGGRAFFANAGRTRNRGLEVGVGAAVLPRLTLTGAYTLADYTFTDYKVRNGAAVDTLDGNRLAGVPQHFLRAGLRTTVVPGLTLDLDQLLSGSVFADDANTLVVDGWGAGVTNLRLAWSGSLAGIELAPFLSVSNLFDRQYVGSVTINGFGGRVLEPSPGRYLFLGAGIGWKAR